MEQCAVPRWQKGAMNTHGEHKVMHPQLRALCWASVRERGRRDPMPLAAPFGASSKNNRPPPAPHQGKWLHLLEYKKKKKMFFLTHLCKMLFKHDARAIQEQTALINPPWNWETFSFSFFSFPTQRSELIFPIHRVPPPPQKKEGGRLYSLIIHPEKNLVQCKMILVIC